MDANGAITLTIDDREVRTNKAATILEAALGANIYIPSLCYHPDLPAFDSVKPVDKVQRGDKVLENTNSAEPEGCRLCYVAIEGCDAPQLACKTVVKPDMRVETEAAHVQKLRRDNLARILANHPHACLTCAQREGCSLEPCSTNVPVEERCCILFGRCELQKVAGYIGIKEDTGRYAPEKYPIIDTEPLFNIDYNLCIGCLRCVRVCKDVRGVDALGLVNHKNAIVVGIKGASLKDAGCRFCGACVEVCPTGALTDKKIIVGEREKELVPCIANCPVGVDIPRYVGLIREEGFEAADSVIREKIPLPSVVARVCPSPCENACRRKELNEPVSICALKRFAADYEREHPPKAEPLANTREEKVAIIGSGPAGLTAAYYLAKLGYKVTIFEAHSEPGGMMRFGIPAYRLPRAVLEGDINAILRSGIELETNVDIGEKITLDDLKNEYRVILLATGAIKSMRLGIEGEELKGVHYSIEFLRAVSSGNSVEMGPRVAVIGGGNAAMDAARTALRLNGVEHVMLIYRRTRTEMPAIMAEVEEAAKEGVELRTLESPRKIIGENGTVRQIECIKMRLGELDRTGRKRPHPVDGTEFVLDVSSVIIAIGQTPASSFLSNIKSTEKGLIEIDPETYKTNIDGIFASGDVTGTASVIEAIASGRQAASSIDRYIGGEGIIDGQLMVEEKYDFWSGREEGFADKTRAKIPQLPFEQRRKNFAEVNLGFDKTEALQEANRCLRCDLRFEIAQPVLPSEKEALLKFNETNINSVPEDAGVYQLMDDQGDIIYVKGATDLREELKEQLGIDRNAHYFVYEIDPMYTKRETELLQQYMQEHGRMPECNEELDDLF